MTGLRNSEVSHGEALGASHAEISYFIRISLFLFMCSASLLLSSCGGSEGSQGTLTASRVNSQGAGTVVSNRAVQLFAAPGVPLSGTSRLITYESTDHFGAPVLITGTVTVPNSTWNGPGKRPIVSYAVGTHGLGDSCAPSQTMTQGTDNDSRLVELLLLQGYAVVITDYVGSGTDEPATYLNRLGQGRAVLDAIRAAQRVPEANLPDNGPVATFGYSQGGEGSAAAIEIQPSYAPELNLIGGYAGAIPSELLAVLGLVDGSQYAAFMGYIINGMNAAFPENRLFDNLNAAGKAFARATSEECVPTAFVPHALLRSNSLFTDGRSLADHLSDAVWQAPVADLKLGQSKPRAPVFIAHSIADDVIPISSSRDVAKRWCDLGAAVQFATTPVPTHLAASNPIAISAISWLRDRVNGLPAPNNCSNF
jgi:pimeloyl-ACP methyl ester carboxylesterase